MYLTRSICMSNLFNLQIYEQYITKLDTQLSVTNSLLVIGGYPIKYHLGIAISPYSCKDPQSLL